MALMSPALQADSLLSETRGKPLQIQERQVKKIRRQSISWGLFSLGLLGWGTEVKRDFWTVNLGNPDFKFTTLNKWETPRNFKEVYRITEEDGFGSEILISCNFKHYFSPQDKESDTLQLSEQQSNPYLIFFFYFFFLSRSRGTHC